MLEQSMTLDLCEDVYIKYVALKYVNYCDYEYYYVY